MFAFRLKINNKCREGNKTTVIQAAISSEYDLQIRFDMYVKEGGELQIMTEIDVENVFVSV